MYVVIVFSLCVLSNRISYPMISRCSATADLLSGHGASVLYVLGIRFQWFWKFGPHTLPHSHRMQYTLDVLRPRLPLISLNVIEVFFLLECGWF